MPKLKSYGILTAGEVGDAERFGKLSRQQPAHGAETIQV